MPGQSEGDECPATPQCLANTLRTCSDAGVPVDVPCGEARCAADAPQPRCVPATALPCTPRRDPARCVNGRIIACDEASGYLLEASCPRGSLCIGEGSLARCDLAASIPCSESRWAPLCVDDQLFTCGEGSRVTVTEGC